MTIDISNNDPRISYFVAQGVTQPSFTVPFEFFDDSDVNVYVDGILKTITTDYTISGGGGSTGTVTISVTGASGGSVVVLTRDITIERTTDFTAGADINRAALNTQLDTLTAIAADVKDRAGLALSYNDRTVGVPTELPDVAVLKGNTLAFNASTGAPEAGPTIGEISSAGTFAANASNSATAAASSASSASGSASSASDSATAAASSATAAAASATAAAASETAAEIAESNTLAIYGSTQDVADAVAAAAASESAAAASEAAAASSEVAAAASESAAATSASNAATSATNAASSASSASTSATSATTSANNASNSATAAASSASAASASETAAAASEAAAAVSKTAAAASETAAAASQAAAATSESNAASSQSSASTSASNAATSETNAANSATAASTSATAAASSASSASASADAALAALDSFDDRYLGQKVSDPTLDNDGNPLVAGALYFNATDDVMKVYEGSVWVAAYASLSGALLVSNNLSDLTNASAARTNLGLGTAATTASTDYATAAQGALANSAVQPNDSPTFGSINVTGTVDGRDVAADGSKLDGIATGATANTGTVTSVAASAGTGISISGSPVTTSGTLTITNTAPHIATNLGYTTAASTGTVTSSTGTNATLPAATTTLAGLLTGADKTKLNGIAAGAQVNKVLNVFSRMVVGDFAWSSSSYVTLAPTVFSYTPVSSSSVLLITYNISPVVQRFAGTTVRLGALFRAVCGATIGPVYQFIDFDNVGAPKEISGSIAVPLYVASGSTAPRDISLQSRGDGTTPSLEQIYSSGHTVSVIEYLP